MPRHRQTAPQRRCVPHGVQTLRSGASFNCSLDVTNEIAGVLSVRVHGMGCHMRHASILGRARTDRTIVVRLKKKLRDASLKMVAGPKLTLLIASKTARRARGVVPRPPQGSWHTREASWTLRSNVHIWFHYLPIPQIKSSLKKGGKKKKKGKKRR